MHRKALRSWPLMFLACLPATARATALTPLADRLPAGTIVYLGWSGTDVLRPAYGGSHLKKILDDTNLVDVIRQELPKLRSQVEHGKDAAQDNATEKVIALAIRHPACLFVSVVQRPGRPKPDARVGILIDAGNDVGELQKDIQDANPADAPADVKIGSLNSVVWIVNGTPEPFEPLHGGADSLSATDRFVASQKHLGGIDAPVFTTFVDLSAAVKLADDAAERDDNGKKFWPRIRDTLGVGGLQSFSSSIGFAGPNWATTTFLAAPLPRKGLLAVIEPKPIDPVLLAHLPGDADDITAANFDIALLFDTVRAAANVNPDVGDMFGKVIGAGNLFVGRNIRRQLLAPLGPQWVMAFSSSQPKSGEVLNAVNDPHTLQDSLTTATYTLSNTMNVKLPAQADGTPGAVASQEKRDGITLTTVTTAAAAPSWAIHDSVLAAGASADAVMHTFTSIGTPVGGNAVEAVKHAFNLPPSATMGGFAFADLPRSAPVMYARLAAAGPILAKLADQFHVTLPDVRLPTLDELKPELSPAMSVDWAEEDGIGMRSTSPFPGSGMLAASQNVGAASVGGAAIGASILLPSLNHARETANKVKSASNERQIGQGILLYGNEHHGQYPATLGELITETLTPEVFVSPLSSNAVPAGLDTPAKQTDWINQHSDYIYLGNGMNTNAAAADTVVVYEKLGAGGSDGGMNVLYGDGHVEYQNAAAAAQIRSAHPAP